MDASKEISGNAALVGVLLELDVILALKEELRLAWSLSSVEKQFSLYNQLALARV